MPVKIVIDPGHGKDSKGNWRRPLMKHSSGKTYREDMGTLEIAKLLKEKLVKKGYQVFLTREDERSAKLFLEEKYSKKKLWSVTKWIKWFTVETKADIFISIHTNALNKKVRGTSCFWFNPKSEKLAKELCEKISKEFQVPIRNVKKKGFLIIKDNTKSGLEVLLECLFHDNNDDLGLLINKKDELADSIVSAIEDFLSSKS